MIRISIFFNPEIYKKVKALSKKYKLSIAHIIRIAVQSNIDNQDFLTRLKNISDSKKWGF